MEHVVGVGALALVGCVTACLSLRARCVGWALMAAYTVRAGAAVFHEYVASLPDGGSDAQTLERVASNWGSNGFITALGHFPGPDSYFYSWFVSLFYAVVGRNHLMAQSLSVVAGIGSVYLVWKLARELWGEYHARKATWVAALFPTLILYSSLTLREPFIVFFTLLGLMGLVRWVGSGGPLSVALVLVGFIMATFFHGAMFIAIIVFTMFFVARHGSQWLAALQRARIRVFATLLLSAVFVCAATYLVIGYNLPKLGSPEDLVDVGRYINQMEYSSRGTAGYPDWAVPSDENELVWKVPIRIVYFLFAPFSWDLTKTSHVVGWIDGFFYMVIAFCLWRHWGSIWRKPEARAVLLMMLALVLVFGVAIGNFGTGLRHRAKFVATALALIAPRLPTLVMRARKKEPAVVRKTS